MNRDYMANMLFNINDVVETIQGHSINDDIIVLLFSLFQTFLPFRSMAQCIFLHFSKCFFDL